MAGDTDIEAASAQREGNRPKPVQAEVPAPFEVVAPREVATPLVFSSPHSGSVYPERFLQQSRLDASNLRRSEDAYVDALFAAAAIVGAPMLRANFPRAYLDLNREPYELDPRMFKEALPEFANTRSLRVAAGLGTIPRVVADAREIYAAKLPVTEALERIERLYKPFHATLAALLDSAWRRFGVAVLVDCHSMPSTPPREDAPMRDKRPVDFVIGDRFGSSCNVRFVEILERRLREFGYEIRRNKPYAGGFITAHYGRPALGRHALQIEVARSLYMNETTLERNERFDLVAEHLREAIAELAQELASCEAAQNIRSAAE